MKTLFRSLSLILAVATIVGATRYCHADRDEQGRGAESPVVDSEPDTAGRNVLTAITVNPERLGDSSKRSVLIFYASETRKTEKFDQVIQWLQSVDKAKAEWFEKRVAKDARAFPQATDATVENLIDRAGRSEPAGDLAVVVFSTRDTKNGFFRHFRLADGQVSKVDFQIPSLAGEGFAVYPQSHPEVFKAALEQVARLYSPQEQEYVLITKSHGSEEYALTGLSGKIEIESERELCRLAFADQLVSGLLGTAR